MGRTPLCRSPTAIGAQKSNLLPFNGQLGLFYSILSPILLFGKENAAWLRRLIGLAGNDPG
jgi:hypothetical protein